MSEEHSFSSEPSAEPSPHFYEVMLKIQADAAFAEERSLLCGMEQISTPRILDYGCGNGYYLSLLGALIPNAELLGVDVDLKFVSVATRHFGHLARFTTDLEGEAVRSFEPNGIVLRLVLHHLQEPVAAFSRLVDRFPNLRHIYVVNPCDKHFSLQPGMNNFLRDLGEIRQPHRKRRDIHDEIRCVALSKGFEEAATRELVIATNSPVEKNQMFAYMFATACYGGRTAPKPDTFEELIEWLSDPAGSAQYGLVASSFVRST